MPPTNNPAVHGPAPALRTDHLASIGYGSAVPGVGASEVGVRNKRQSVSFRAAWRHQSTLRATAIRSVSSRTVVPSDFCLNDFLAILVLVNKTVLPGIRFNESIAGGRDAARGEHVGLGHGGQSLAAAERSLDNEPRQNLCYLPSDRVWRCPPIWLKKSCVSIFWLAQVLITSLRVVRCARVLFSLTVRTWKLRSMSPMKVRFRWLPLPSAERCVQEQTSLTISSFSSLR